MLQWEGFKKYKYYDMNLDKIFCFLGYFVAKERYTVKSL